MRWVRTSTTACVHTYDLRQDDGLLISDPPCTWFSLPSIASGGPRTANGSSMKARTVVH